jgi:hypothetical protein
VNSDLGRQIGLTKYESVTFAVSTIAISKYEEIPL